MRKIFDFVTSESFVMVSFGILVVTLIMMKG